MIVGESDLVTFTNVSEPSVMVYRMYREAYTGDLDVYVDDILDHSITLSTNINSWLCKVFPLDTGTHKIIFRNDKYYDSGDTWVDDMEIVSYPASYTDDGFETGDLSVNEYYYESNSASVSSDTANTGTYSLRLGVSEYGSGEYEVTIPVYFTALVNISFDARVDDNGDYIRFYVDGDQENNIHSTTWTSLGPVVVDTGYHILTWQFDKDYSNADEYGWIDDILFVE